MKMKKFMNAPETVTDEELVGLGLAYPDILNVDGHLVISKDLANADRVTIVTYGGSGHEPAQAGFVGKGMLDIQAVGDIFAAPNGQLVFDAMKMADKGHGVLLLVLNHAGDMLCGNMVMKMAGKAGLIPIGGDALGLEPPRLALAAALLALYGGLNAVGFGSTAPSLATLYALGLNPMAAFPVVMGACAVSLSVGAVKFIRSGAYGRKISLLSSLCGVVGVIVAVEVVKGLDVGLLQWLVAGMILYTGFSMLRKELLRRREIRAQA